MTYKLIDDLGNVLRTGLKSKIKASQERERTRLNKNDIIKIVEEI